MKDLLKRAHAGQKHVQQKIENTSDSCEVFVLKGMFL